MLPQQRRPVALMDPRRHATLEHAEQAEIGAIVSGWRAKEGAEILASQGSLKV